jgi:hypothetical protein
MIKTLTKQLLSTTLSFLLVVTATPFEVGAQQTGPTGYSGQGAPMSAAELEQLAAPIALYPDALVAQILGAATFPDQVAYVNNWLQQNKNLTGKTLMRTVDAQPWDPSVKALTQFPSVLDNMAKNLSWTSALGEAYHTQAADVMFAVQSLRAKAQSAGNLKSGSQIVVVQQAPQTIVIQSANPQVVYVPMYNPTVVYGYPYVTPGYSTTTVVATGMLAFGAGIAVGAMMSGGCCGWGYSSWNCGWHSTTVVYRGGSYYGNSAWHGGYYGSSGSAYGPNGAAHYSSGYNPSTGTYARGATVSNSYGSQSVGQAYNPKTGAYGTTQQGSNANGSWGSSTVSKNGNTAYTQHQTTSQGTTASMQTSNGGKAVGASGQYNSAAVGESANGNKYGAAQTANGNKYAAQNGNVYKNTGSGWQQTQPPSSSNAQKSGSSGYSGQSASSYSNSAQKTSGSSYSGQSASSYSGASNAQKYSGSSSGSAASKGWGGQEKSGGSSAFSGGSGGGWGSRSASARGAASSGGGGGWGGRSGGGGGGRR